MDIMAHCGVAVNGLLGPPAVPVALLEQCADV